MVKWGPPRPPAISGPHRYVFMVFEQPDGVTAERVKEEMGWVEKLELGLWDRIRWDQAVFEEKLGLGGVVAGGGFWCG